MNSRASAVSQYLSALGEQTRKGLLWWSLVGLAVVATAAALALSVALGHSSIMWAGTALALGGLRAGAALTGREGPKEALSWAAVMSAVAAVMFALRPDLG